MTDSPHARIPLWVDLRHVPRNKRLGYLGAAREAKAEGILLERGDEHVKKEGVEAVAVDAKGTLRRGPRTVGRIVRVTDAASQRSAARGKGLVVVEAPDWRVIPLENLIAARRDRPGTLYAHAATPQQARLFADTLETGVHGIVLAPVHIGDIADTDRLLRGAFPRRLPSRDPGDSGEPDVAITVSAGGSAGSPMELVEARITRIEDAGPGDRVCIDCTGSFQDGEGLLVGSTARSFALVHAETKASDLIAPRPFRVNAGALHSYVLGPQGRTHYLSEVAAGMRALAVSPRGQRELTIGRAKVETRPHTMLHWDSPAGPASVVLQTAETVRLATPTGPRAITELAIGDTLLVHHEEAGRHTGLPVDGRLEER
ncbi:MAG TPA: 3-dehydroquinate synthase II [Candidatus Thermoplasmatota archaeon]|nr:3-dehydroquinate synthase II [Candidatus Thermoplasmatota archaeon]